MRGRRSGDDLKVWFLTTSPEIWGAQQSLLTLEKHLKPHGISASLFTSSPKLVDEWTARGYQGQFVSRMTRGPAIIRSAFWAYSFLRGSKDRPDVVVVFDLALVPMVGVLRVLLGKPRMILDLHNYLTTERGRRRIRWLSRYFDRVIAISNFTASQVAHDVAVEVITRPIERDLIVDSSGTGEPVVGVVGRLDPDKHLEFALSVARHLPNVRFEVRGSATSEWEGYAARLQASAPPNIDWVGRVSREGAFSGLNALFLSNHREALGRVVLEAQLARVPVVVPSTGGASELVENSLTGFSYQSCDVISAADALVRALEAPNSIVDAAEAYASKVSDPKRYAAEYVRALMQAS